MTNRISDVSLDTNFHFRAACRDEIPTTRRAPEFETRSWIPKTRNSRA